MLQLRRRGLLFVDKIKSPPTYSNIALLEPYFKFNSLNLVCLVQKNSIKTDKDFSDIYSKQYYQTNIFKDCLVLMLLWI